MKGESWALVVEGICILLALVIWDKNLILSTTLLSIALLIIVTDILRTKFGQR